MMRFLRYVARIVLVGAGCVVATVWLGWMAVPVVGFVYGVADVRGRARGSIAACGAVLAWAAILGAEWARGANVLAAAELMGTVMQVPWLVFAVLTLVFAAILCGTGAVLGGGFHTIRN